ncbi:MAG: 2-oxoacid:acceptor oxidoreductase subunit alpha [Candidatus Omnitrophota bacterium]
MNNELNIRITGEAGQGIQTVGEALCRVFKRRGFYLFAHQDYMSRIRGGNNFFLIRVSSQPLFAARQKADIVVALDKESVAIHKNALSPDGILIADKARFNIPDTTSSLFDVPLYGLATQFGGSELFVNSTACAVVAAMAGIEFSLAEEILSALFRDKGEELVKKNLAAAKAGYDFAAQHFSPEAFRMQIKTAAPEGQLLINGNEAIALGAIRAGCKFYSAYPMTPSTSIMDNLAHFAKRFNILVEQAEDEIAAVNMIIGASFAGCRAMAATSGGGFALMVEGLSLAGMTEVPIVVVEAQRPGPATGFPTRTEQADLEFLIHAGHGEFARAIFSPGTIEEAFYLTVRAFDVAEKYQIPVLIMTDQHLADSYRNIEPFDLSRSPVKRHIISRAESKDILGYKRYQLTESGVSPRAIPSWIADVIYADSDEHNEEGHITEDATIRVKMVEKRLYKKLALLTKEIVPPSAYNLENAQVVLAGFGSTYGVMREVCVDKRIGFIHFSQVWPFPSQQAVALLKGAKKIFTVENNAAGQLKRLIRREIGINPDGAIRKFDGRPFDRDNLREKIQEVI